MMENREGERVGGQTIRDRLGGAIVTGQKGEELFEFCYDQLMNGNLRERREMVDYLVEEFDDEMSLWMVEGFTNFANREAPQDKTNGEEADHSVDTKEHEASTLKLPIRKSSRLVKKGRSVTDQQDKKKGDENDDTKQQKDISKREKDRRYYQNMSEQKKRERVQKKRQRIRSDVTLREKERAASRKYLAKMTEEQKAKRLVQRRNRMRQKWQNMTEDQRKVVRQKRNDAKKRSNEKKQQQNSD